MSDVQNNLFASLQSNQPTSLIATSTNPLFNDSTTNTGKGFFMIIKYVLIFINAFTGMIGIFIVLFGISYPEEKFPGDLKGRTCALLSIVYIVWTLIGYCGAHHQKFSFLLIYSGLVVFYVFANIIIFGVLASKPWLDVNLFWMMCAYFTILMAIGLLHAYQIRLQEERNDDPMIFAPGSMYGATAYMGQMSTPMMMQSYAANNVMQTNLTANPGDNPQLYMNNNYMTNYPQPQEASSSRGMNYFQRSWNRMSSKRMGNFFNRSTYRPNGNITTELKPMTFNTSTTHPY